MITVKDIGWITPYIKQLYSLKRDFYVLIKNFNDMKFMNDYKLICRTLSHTIK
jgi:hypothetical protein